MIIPSLNLGGYQTQAQINIGLRVTGKRHIVDVIAQDTQQRQYLVSLKWQQVSGTAEQKVPFEVICLVDAIKRSQSIYRHGYLVLGGDRWTLRDFYIQNLEIYLPHRQYVTILTLEAFVAKANRGQL